MGSPYDSVSVTGYNSNPPSDDGAQTEANRGKWSTIKTKLGDPLNTAVAAINAAVLSAFGKVGGGITSTGISYQIASTDQGKTIKVTAAGVTITTPDATDVTSPFKFKVLNLSSGDITLDGSGSQTVDSVASITIPSGAGVDVDTDSSNWFTGGQNFSRTQVIPQGYLTLVTGTPVITSDQTAKTSVFYTPDQGALLPIPDGTNFSVKEFSELTLSLVSNHVANSIYDVFGFLDPSDGVTIRIGTGPAWTTVTAGSGARGTGAGTTELFRLKGLLVNAVAATMRNGSTTYSVALKKAIYLGSIYMDGTNGQVSCHVSYGQSRKWAISNAYNRRRIYLKAGDGTASWNYTTATYRAADGSTANSLTAFSGLADEEFQFSRYQNVGNSSANLYVAAGIGFNSTSATSGFASQLSIPAASAGPMSIPVSTYVAPPSLGINVITALEKSDATGTTTWYGTEANMLLVANYRG